MSHFTDVLAFQGAGMIGRPVENHIVSSGTNINVRVRDVLARAIEHRMVETLQNGGFTGSEIDAMLTSVLPTLRSGERITSSDIGDKLRENGVPAAMVTAITESIAEASSHR